MKKAKKGNPKQILELFRAEFVLLTKRARLGGILGDDEVIIPEVKINSYIEWDTEPISDKRALRILAEALILGKRAGLSAKTISQIEAVRANLGQPIDWWFINIVLSFFLNDSSKFQNMMRRIFNAHIKPINNVSEDFSSDGRPVAFVMGKRTERLKIE